MLQDHIQTDDEKGVITIYGINYTEELFRGLGFETPLNSWIRITKREDGVIDIEEKKDV